MVKLHTLGAGLLSCTLVAGCGGSSSSSSSEFENDLDALRMVLSTNADIAFAVYSDAVDTAQALKTALTTLANDQDAAALEAAKQAWLVAREPYGQSEVYRFRNSPIDDDPDTADAEDGPEGSLNAWPLGEALIDYVQATTSDFTDDQVGVSDHQVTGVTNPITAAFANANMADNIIGSTVTIDDALLDTSASADDEHDVISGYHAIEFLLWGQDLNSTGAETSGSDRNLAVKTHDAANRAMGGERPLSDFNTTNGVCTTAGAVAADATPCMRRHEYLTVAVDKLIAELEFVRDHWAAGTAGNYRDTFENPADLAAAEASFLEILTGMGTMSEGELAGERMQISLSANSQEDEHSCFSDNTHRDIWLNAEGVANMFNGEYAGYDSTLDGTDDNTARAVSGFGIDDYLAEVGADELSSNVTNALTETETNYTALDAAARAGMPVDVLVQDAAGADAAPMRDTIVSLNAQSTLIAQIAVDLELGSADEVVDPDASECDTTDPTAEC
ncbi:MAG: imelysin family protein [Pseudomonadota bacterium]